MLKVKVSLSYVQRCEECVRYAEQTVRAALRDGQVTGIVLTPVGRCEHETGEDLTKRLQQPKAAGAATGSLLEMPGAAAPGYDEPGVG